jgi:glycosyltransferase involved in cell wall biosynthesis
MGEPLVVCVMLVDGREAMVRRAIASFRAQTYQRKRLLIVASDHSDNDVANATLMRHPDGVPRLAQTICFGGSHSFAPFETIPDDIQLNVSKPHYKTVGALRNFAGIGARAMLADCIAHWDSDDWSHPWRLEDQITLLEDSGKMCVGYKEVLFWDTRNDHTSDAAWLYCHPDPRWAAGASFLYRRELWEQQPFDDAPHEDQRWWLTPLVSNQCVGVSSLWPRRSEPRMVCQIHGQNTEAYDPLLMLAGSQVWKRAPEFDAHCAEVMCLSR